MRAACWELLFYWAGTGAAVRPEGDSESFYITSRAEMEREEKENNMGPGLNFRQDFLRLSLCIRWEKMEKNDVMMYLTRVETTVCCDALAGIVLIKPSRKKQISVQYCPMRDSTFHSGTECEFLLIIFLASSFLRWRLKRLIVSTVRHSTSWQTVWRWLICYYLLLSIARTFAQFISCLF